ncbi:MAG TPA: cold shock domain-containing protein [Candidatus Acidoferrales bacterium]|nr:cold shock domain-containing protein [Candidatus Acidoferrales bacterium]
MRKIGTVREWDKTFGWIVSEAGGRNVFVHQSEIVEMPGFRKLYAEDRVEYELEETYRGPRAVRVKLLEEAPEAVA